MLNKDNSSLWPIIGALESDFLRKVKEGLSYICNVII